MKNLAFSYGQVGIFSSVLLAFLNMSLWTSTLSKIETSEKHGPPSSARIKQPLPPPMESHYHKNCSISPFCKLFKLFEIYQVFPSWRGKVTNNFFSTKILSSEVKNYIIKSFYENENVPFKMFF